MKENSRFYSSLSLLIVLNAVIKPLWIFGIDRQVQNTVGASAYGIYFSLLNLSIVLNFLLDLGFTNYVNRQLAANDETLKNNTRPFLRLKIVLALCYMILLLLLGWLTGIQRMDILLYTGLIQVATSFFLFFRTLITANQWFATDAWLSVLDKSGMILLCGALLYLPTLAGTMSIGIFLLLQLSCTVFAMLTALFILYRRSIKLYAQHSAIAWQPILLNVLPFAMIILLQSAHNRLDGFLLERLHPDGAHQAGLYAASYRLLDAANMIGYLFASFLMPFIARQWAEQKDIGSIVLTSRHFLISYSITLASLGIWLAPWLQQILYHHNDRESISILEWCVPALIGYSLTAIYGTVLTATGRVVILGYITFCCLLVNVVLNIILIPLMGAKGCCIAALVSQTAAGIAAVLVSKDRLKNYLHVRSLLIYTFMALALSALLYAGRHYPGKLLLAITAGMITAAIMISTRMIDFRQWSRILKKSNTPLS